MFSTLLGQDKCYVRWRITGRGAEPLAHQVWGGTIIYIISWLHERNVGSNYLHSLPGFQPISVLPPTLSTVHHHNPSAQKTDSETSVSDYSPIALTLVVMKCFKKLFRIMFEPYQFATEEEWPLHSVLIFNCSSYSISQRWAHTSHFTMSSKRELYPKHHLTTLLSTLSASVFVSWQNCYT